jgi:O-antigen ligase
MTSAADPARLRAPAKSTRAQIAALSLLCGLLVLAMLTGGGSRPELPSHLILRPACVMLGAAACFLLVREDLDRVRVPLLFLLALAALMILQLIPLPPALWTALPGRSLYSEASGVLGFDQPWRPISLSPGRTWNSLVALLPPLAALLLFAATPVSARTNVLITLIALIAASAVLGLAQRTGPPGGALYLYSITNEASAVGFFANRNHQSLALACLFPMLGAFAALPSRDGKRRPWRLWLALGGAVALIPLLLATGSRSGAALSLVGLLFGGLLLRSGGATRRIRPVMLWGALAALIGAMIVLTMVFARADALYRIAGGEMNADLRIRLLEPVGRLIADTFPFGIGFGAFEPVFRVVEPAEMLHRAYVNNAHNDLLQIVLEGGLPAVLLLLAFLAWLGRRCWRVWRVPAPLGITDTLARLGSVLALMILAASLVDYPLRTPFMMILFAVSLGLMGRGRDRGTEGTPG